MKEKELKQLKLTKNIIIPFPNFQQNTIISPTQMNDNFEEIEYAYNNLIDNHNGAITKMNEALAEITSTDNEAISNEQARIQAEEIRVQNEEQRINDENERRAEEKKRIAMYNIHLNDELRREQKHTEMVNTFDTKVSEVNTFVDTKKQEIDSFVSTKTEEVEEFVDLKTNEVNNFITTKTTEVNAFVTAKGQEVQNAIKAIPPKSELIGAKGDKGDKGEKGEKGDRGERGLQGIQGERGLQGVKGDTPSITHLETSINNKISDVETRFNRLTSQQQQSSEVIDARDGETSLKARLDKFNSQLEHKPNKNHIWNMANMGQDVKEAMTGGSVAVVGKNAILTENVVDKQITPEKTNFINNTVDFELERGTINNGVNNDNAHVNRRLRCRGFIENENKMYILRKNSDFLIGVSTYDGNIYDGVDLGWFDRDVIEIEKGKNLRFNVRKRDNSDITEEEIEIAKNSIEVRYEFLVASNSEVSKLSKAVEENMVIHELVPEREEYELGGMGSGNDVASVTRVRTHDFIEVNAGDLIKFNLDGSKFKYGVNLYDENKKWNGVDYGWMDYPKFKLEQKGYVKVVLKYEDNRVITDIASDEITNKPISIVSDFKALVFNELNNIKVNMRNNTYVKELETSAFEIGTITGNTPETSNTRVRLKDYIRMGSGDIVHFNKSADGFRWGISISNLDGEWNGVDYGWLSQKQFVIEQECLVKFVLRYADNRGIDGTNINELCNKTITIEKDMDKYILEELESLKNKDKDLIKNTAMSSINVEYGRISGASYVFVRIPKVTNDGSKIVPKVVLTSDDGSISGTKCSTLDYSRKHNSIFTINAGLFDMKKLEPVGQLIIDGVSLINTPMVDDNGVPISDTECYPLAIDRDWNLTTYPRNVDTSEMLEDGVKYAVTAWGKLVDNFKICTEDINNEIVHKNKRYIRQSIGQYQNGDYCVCSVDMTRGNVKNEAGLYYEELAQIFVDKGVKFAYSLDGGGSTQTVIGKRQLNPIYEGSTGRKVPTVIEFVVE